MFGGLVFGIFFWLLACTLGFVFFSTDVVQMDALQMSLCLCGIWEGI